VVRGLEGIDDLGANRLGVFDALEEVSMLGNSGSTKGIALTTNLEEEEEEEEEPRGGRGGGGTEKTRES